MLGFRNHFLSLAILSIAYAVVVVSGQSTAGFINIDCGKAKDYTYNDSTFGFSYTDDFQYVDTGEIHNIASTVTGYDTQAYDLRSFPEGKRNCYTLKPVEKGNKYLVRAQFLYGNYDGLDKTPQFDLFLGADFWASISMANGSVYYFTEIMAVASSDKMFVCLINTGSGTPFISALELRPLPSSLYPQVNSSQALILYNRADVGAAGVRTVRYPSDRYDRFWIPSSPIGWTRLSITSSVSTTPTYEPPQDVMSTACYPTVGSTMIFSWPLKADFLLKDPRFYIFLHFAELQNLNDTDTREFNITFNGEQFSEPVDPVYLMTTTIYTPNPINYKKLEFSLVETSDSTLPPILNAAEVYTVKDTKTSETDDRDVDAAMAIKASYNVRKNWMGDPCSPIDFMWDGLNCSAEGFTKPRIVSLDLSSSGLTGEIVTSFAKLAQLQYLDLSKNNLTGGVPDILADLTLLKFLDLSGNNLNGYVPKILLDRSAAGAMTLRYDSRNLCNDSNCKEGEKKSANKIGIVVAVIIGAVVLLAVGVLILVFIFKKRRNPENQASEANIPTRTQVTQPKSGSFRMSSFRRENRQFTADDLVKITNNFNKEIGRGGFGPVFYGWLVNNAEVAVKMLSESSSHGQKQFQTEAHLLTRIHHKNLVTLVGYCNDTSSLALVYEYMAEGSLYDHLAGKARNSLSWLQRLRVSIEAAQGLEYLHVGCKPSIVHRDVKTSNILLNANLEAKISDFGLSKLFQNDAYSHISTMVMGTPGYLDPEYHVTNKLNEKSDVYSFGVVLLELITGLPAIVKGPETTSLVYWVRQRYERGEIKEIIDKRIEGDLDINSIWKAAETAMACVAPTAIQRPAMSDVLFLLRECLEIETSNARNRNSGQFNSMSSVEAPPVSATMVFRPSAR